MFSNKSVLVTGGAGFIGANLVKRLVELGANVRASLHTKDEVIKDDRIEYVQCNLLKPEDCLRVCQDMEYVFLCAAVTSGAAVIEGTPLAHLTPNLIMNAQMLEAAYAIGVKKVLFISSSTVYPATDYPVNEDDVADKFFEKYFIVGWMKRFSEIMCEMYSTKIKNPMETCVVRPANIYGPLDDFEWETSHVISSLIRKVVERHDPIEVWGDGMDIKDFIYVEDFIEGTLLAMGKSETYEVFNIASGNQYVLIDILEIILETDGYEIANIAYDKSKPTMIAKRLIDPSKSKELLRFEAKTGIKEGLKKTIKWYRSSL